MVVSITADRAVLATGAFFAHDDTPAASLDLAVGTHTMLTVEIPPADAGRLADLPSLILKPGEPGRDCFVLSRKTLSDGRAVVKIAVSHQGLRLTVDEITAWFRTDGDPEQADRQEGLLMDLLPGLAVVGRTTVPCVTTYAPSGHPVVDDLTPRVSAVIGGNGHVAKCAPALGEIAAGRLLGEPWPTGVDRDLFALPAG